MWDKKYPEVEDRPQVSKNEVIVSNKSPNSTTPIATCLQEKVNQKQK